MRTHRTFSDVTARTMVAGMPEASTFKTVQQEWAAWTLMRAHLHASLNGGCDAVPEYGLSAVP
eukprot:1157486-Pelagomonas_calceolata.AAC.9